MWTKVVPMNILERERTGEPCRCAECDTEVVVVKLDERHSRYFCWKCNRDHAQAIRQERDDLKAEVERLRGDVEFVEKTLALAARRFAAEDNEGVRLLLCDMDARENARKALAGKDKKE